MFARLRHTRKRFRPRALFGNLIADMQSRLEDEPADVRLRLSLVSHLRMAGRYEEAVQHVKRVLQVNPGNRQAKRLLLRLKLEQRVIALQRSSG